MSLICPNCGAPLTERAWAGVTVDACPGCRGLWMDRGELGQIQARIWALQHDLNLAEGAEAAPPIRWGRFIRYPRRHPQRRLGRSGFFR